MRKFLLHAMTMLMFVLVMSGTSPASAAENSMLQGTYQRHYYSEMTQVTGSWKKVGKLYRFVTDEGKTMKGWLKIGSRTYHLNKYGFRQTGLVKIGSKYYYFGKKGVQKFGYIKINKKTYYFDPEKHGAGRKASADGLAAASEQAAAEQEATQQETEQAAADEANASERKPAKALKFDSDGNFYDRKGYPVEKATLRKLLQTAMQPVGKTMYIWGGGWGNKSGGPNVGSVEASTIGVSSRWAKFFKKAKKNYNYRKFRYQSHLGLDCSGYVGWVLYNTLNSKNGRGDYVMLAQNMARTFSGWGWGKYSAAGTFRDYRPGDIMSLAAGHVYIVIGQCSDGSIVLVHSSPKGVMITGTYTRSGKKNSKAVKLAKKYMKKYFPKWYKKYPDSSRNASYLKLYARMRWNLTGKKNVLSDPDGLADMDAKQVLNILLGPV